MRKGFTLVELSIVIAIIALITGGILGGMALIKNSELQSIQTDISKLRVGVGAFQLKYGNLPGDMPDASSYWGLVSAGCTTQAGTGTQTCNGNGNGYIGGFSTGMEWEALRFWQHLGLAQMYPGSFTGVPGPGGGTEHVPGVSAPRSKMDGVTYGAFWLDNSVGTQPGSWFAADFGNFVVVGGFTTGGHPWASTFLPEDAASIDKKMDDGFPGRGLVMTFNNSDCASTTVPSTATYVLTTNYASCTLLFAKAFQ